MSQELLIDISRALEQKMYRDRDLGLLEYLRSQANDSNRLTHLKEISQIEDVNVLEDLMRVGVTAESFAALMWLPLVRIAWADGEVQEQEREAILQAALAEGFAAESSNYQLLQSWLSEGPEPALLEAWMLYARAVAKELDRVNLEAVRQSTLERARRVAKAAGGILGLGNRISKNEELVLRDLSHALDKPSELL